MSTNRRSALVVMDYQAAIVARVGDKGPGLVERTAGALASARAVNAPVIYVVLGFRPGHPEMSPGNPMAALLATTGGVFEGAVPGAEIVAPLRPASGEITVVKHRVGPFVGTDLEQILRAGGIDTIALAGISTSGIVLSTVRHAADLDFRCVVVKDCCGDPDDEVHRVLVDKVFPRQASVVEARELSALLAG